jgi:hypothetical protein
MAQETYLLGIYDDDDNVVEACKQLRAAGVRIDDVFAPFPIHGLDFIVGLKESRLPTIAFIFGLIGLAAALSLQVFTMGIDWPINVGGKPFIPWTSFAPVSFELTVLFAALGMVGFYLYRAQLKPGVIRELADLRQTDDRFVIAIKTVGNTEATLNTVKEVYQKTGALEVREKNITADYELKDDYND